MKTQYNIEYSIDQRISQEKGSLFQQGGRRIALLYPSPYRAGMSSLGYQWVLSLLQHAGFSVERVFLPDNIENWRKSKNLFIVMKQKHPFLTFLLSGYHLPMSWKLLV